jgi:recombination DNA repair RAD52 pathway protein
MFTDEQKSALAAPLNKANVKPPAPGRYGEYIEGWHAIAEANRIFGFDGWSRETDEIRCVSERETKMGKNKDRDGWAVSYTARVRVRVGGIVREGCGAGQGIDADCGLAHESAIKEAETDAMKRAMMTLGYPFGLALYDKSKANVGYGEPEVPESVEAFLSGLRDAYASNSAEEYWTANWPAVDKAWRPYALEQKDQIKLAQGNVALLRAG